MVAAIINITTATTGFKLHVSLISVNVQDPVESSILKTFKLLFSCHIETLIAN